MSLVTLNQLVTPVTYSDALSNELDIAAGLGLPTTAWQPIDPVRTFFTTTAQVISNYSVTINLIAQGAYASYAAIIPGVDANVDSNGYETTWMDLRASDQYNVQRVEAGQGTGTLVLANSTTSTFGSPYMPGTLHFQSPLGSQPTFTNQETVSIAASGNTSVAIVADAAFPGASGNVPNGTTLTLVTPLIGVTVSALTSAIVATPQETNASLLARCQNKLGSLSPNGPSQAYKYVVTSIPVVNSTLPDGSIWTQPTTQYPYGVKAAVTRAGPVLSIGSGVIYVYVANSAGPPEGCSQLAISGITNASPPIVETVSNHGLSNGDLVIITGVTGATGVNNSLNGQIAWTAQSVSSDTFALYYYDGVTPAPAPGAWTGGGTVDGGDLGMCDAAIQAQVVPDGQTAIVAPAIETVIPLTVTVYINGSASLTLGQAQTNIANALDVYLASVPIGGVNAEALNIVPWSELLITIANANPGNVSVNLTSPSGDTALANSHVPVLTSSPSITVVFVS